LKLTVSIAKSPSPTIVALQIPPTGCGEIHDTPRGRIRIQILSLVCDKRTGVVIRSQCEGRDIEPTIDDVEVEVAHRDIERENNLAALCPKRL